VSFSSGVATLVSELLYACYFTYFTYLLSQLICAGHQPQNA